VAWVESHQELLNHPKTNKLVRLLDISDVEAVGHLHCLWWWAMDYAQDGDLSCYDAADIADAAHWKGDTQQFLDALCNCGPGEKAGLVERGEEGSLRIHDWDKYGGKLLKKRQADVGRKKNPIGIPSEVARNYDGIPSEVAGRGEESTGDKNSEDQITGEDKKINAPGGVTPFGPDEQEDEDELPKNGKKLFPEGSEEYELAYLLRSKILANLPDARMPKATPEGLAGWCDHIDKMIRLDKRGPTEIRDVIIWCQHDLFWRSNILSPKKLRDKWEQLVLQSRQKDVQSHENHGRTDSGHAPGQPNQRAGRFDEIDFSQFTCGNE
jgi:hypothetical protein